MTRGTPCRAAYLTFSVLPLFSVFKFFPRFSIISKELRKGAANQLAGVQVFLTSDLAIQDTPIDGETSRFLCVKNGLLDLQTL